MFLAWCWWQAWHGPDLKRRVQSAHSYAVAAGYSTDDEYHLTARVIWAWPSAVALPPPARD